jgi:hypothetical protein
MDLLDLHTTVAYRLYVPGDKAELVAAIAAASRDGRPVRAIGTNYSLSALQAAADVIDTAGALDPAPGARYPVIGSYPHCPGLQMHLCQPFPPGATPLSQQRIRGGGKLLGEIGNKYPGAFANRHFIHVEAGIKGRWLLRDLDSCGLALPTMGAGGGQSLAGALSTATHGGDFTVPPLVEWIRALHLVGPKGQEWWITPATSVFGDRQLLRAMPGWCPGTHIVANDQAFDAARVGAGRTGVVYSMILEVLPAHSLIEVNVVEKRAAMLGLLRRSRIAAGKPSGIFDTPLRDLDSGWFRSAVLERSYVDGFGYHYLSGVPHDQPPDDEEDKQRQYLDLIGRLGLGELADELRGGQPMPLHHLNVVIPLVANTFCFVTRRWRRQKTVKPVGMEPDAREPIVQAVLDNPRNPLAMIDAFRKRLDENEAEPVLELMRYGPLKAYLFLRLLDGFKEIEVPRIAQESAAAGAMSMEALFLMLYELATYPVLTEASMPGVAGAGAKIIGADFKKLVRAGPASGPPYGNIIERHGYELDGAQSGNSAEFSFDASRGEYLDFVEEVIRLADRDAPLLGLIGIRFTPRSSALIAMQRFTLTAAVEIQTGRTRVADVYANFWRDLHQAANRLGGIAHWGQEFRQSATEIAQRYGAQLDTWRRVLGDLSGSHPATFSTKFSRAHGLEPLPGLGLVGEDDAPDIFLCALQAGTDERKPPADLKLELFLSALDGGTSEGQDL